MSITIWIWIIPTSLLRKKSQMITINKKLSDDKEGDWTKIFIF